MVEINGQPIVCVVAGVTLQTGAKVIARFSRCLCAVMTGGAGTGDAAVIEAGRYPARGAVAVIALSAGLYMVRRFSRRGTTVVTGCTGAGGYTAVIENGGYPRNAGVAVVAGIATGDVGGVLAGGGGAVVT